MAENHGFAQDESRDERGTHVHNVASNTITVVDELHESNDVHCERSDRRDMLYTINDAPPWYLSAFLGFQHFLTMIGGTITLPFLLAPEFCIQQDDPARGYILSTIIFVSGIVTFFQSTFGVRLPIVQGGTFTFFVPILAILHTRFPSCNSLSPNLTPEQRQEEWQIRMREVQGAIAVSAIVEVLIGFTGLIGSIASVITPLVVAPTVCLVGLSLYDVAAREAFSHWGISMMTILMMIAFSQYFRNIEVRMPYSLVRVKIFSLFPVVLSILISWLICAILTVTDVLPEDSPARIDTAGDLIAKSPWIRIPYPFQWGLPTVSAAGVFGMIAGVLASIIESVGDYYACARLCGAPPPPRHAINRGIGMEGLGCLISGILGCGSGTTSYSENIGAIGLTKVGSRRVVQYGALIMILCGVFGKFAGIFVTIPKPVVGGIFFVMFSIIVAVGLSSLQHVNLNSSRNLFVLGFSILFGLALPKWLEAHPTLGKASEQSELMRLILVLLRTSMFVGGSLAIILDNTIPGTDEERGLTCRDKGISTAEDESVAMSSGSDVYDLPIAMDLIKRTQWMRKVPFSPTFTGFGIKKSKFWKLFNRKPSTVN